MKFWLTTLLALVIICFNNTYSQQGIIKGKVSDSKSGLPVEADVKLFSQGDSVLIKGTKCDANGIFSIENINAGNYKIEVSFIEYAILTIEKINLAAGSTLSLDTIKLKKQDISTEEILVEEDKGLIQFSADKKIFNVSESTLDKGGTALDVLKKVPLVDVDVNDNVSMRGSQNVKILVDDKPSRYVSLKQIPADAIERIELITNPPAKYESEGVTGLINIVMKKSDKVGFTGSLNAGSTYNQLLAGWGGVDLNLKKNPWTFFSNLYSGTWKNNFSTTGNAQYFSPVYTLQTNGTGRNHGYWVWGQGGLEFLFEEGKTAGFELSVGTGEWFNNDHAQSNTLNPLGQLSSFYTNDNQRNGLWENYTGSLYFNNKIGKEGKEISGDLTLSRNRGDNEFAQIKNDYDSLSVPTTMFPHDQRDTTNNKSYNLNAQVDYVHPLSAIMKIETGYKGTFRENDNNFGSDTLDYSSNSYVENGLISNRFKLDEYINAAYLSFSSSIKDFSYKLGIRAEQTNTTGDLVTTGQNFKQDYFDFFPTVNLSQKIGKGNQVQLSYSRRITRPSIWRLNPFVNRVNPRFLYMGNPELKPEYTNSYELSVMVYTPVVTITPLAFYRQNYDVISNYSFLVDTNVSLTTYRNAAGSKAYGIDLLLSSRALEWLNLNTTFSFYNTKFDSDPLLTSYASEEGFSWKANVRAGVTTKYFNVEFFYNYTGEKINAQGKDIPTQSFDISVSKSLLKDKLTLSLKASDIFDTSRWGQDVNAADYTSSVRSNWSTRNIGLNLSYSFGNTDEYYSKNKKTKKNNNEGTDSQDSNQGR